MCASGRPSSWLLARVVLSVLWLSGCASLPPPQAREASVAVTGTADTRMGKALADTTRANPGLSGVYLLDSAREAFAARVLLARQAERSLDLQYYIWHDDTTGLLLLGEILDAANRGVRVRLLLDDNGIPGLDAVLASLDSHPNVEIRLFNPFMQRGFKTLGYLGDFQRLNRRMHNKSFTADGQVSIVGGRNIGDVYFGAYGELLYADLDVLAAGQVVPDVSTAFDLYWNSQSAYPAQAIIGTPTPETVHASREKLAAMRSSPEGIDYLKAVAATRLVADFIAGSIPLHWAPVRVVYDRPEKVLDQAPPTELLFVELRTLMAQATREIDLVSPYFVPGKAGTEMLAALPGRGIALRILTNSLAATDVPVVFSAYYRHREALVRGGVRLFEMKPDAGKARAARGTLPRANLLGGSSRASLHAKTFTIDRTRSYIGSLNLDPRSVQLNTEMGFIIESQTVAATLGTTLDRQLELGAYEVVLAPGGSGLQWIERTAAGEVRHDRDPNATLLKRISVWFMSLLPIEWML